MHTRLETNTSTKLQPLRARPCPVAPLTRGAIRDQGDGGNDIGGRRRNITVMFPGTKKSCLPAYFTSPKSTGSCTSSAGVSRNSYSAGKLVASGMSISLLR